MMTCLYAVLLAFLPMFLIIAWVGMSDTSPRPSRRPRDRDPGAENRTMK